METMTLEQVRDELREHGSKGGLLPNWALNDRLADAIDAHLAGQSEGVSEELPDDIRVPLDEVRADLGYLFGRVAADGSFMQAAVDSVRLKLDKLSAALTAVWNNRPAQSVCPHIVSNSGGSSYCRLAESSAQEKATNYVSGRVDSTGKFHATAQEKAEPVDVDGRFYVEARQCEDCDHLGINDSSDVVSACSDCEWQGPTPDEDKCPGCAHQNCMAVACPICGGRYRFLADRWFTQDTAPPAKRVRVPAGFDIARAKTLMGYVIGYCKATELRCLSSDAIQALKELDSMLSAAPEAGHG